MNFKIKLLLSLILVVVIITSVLVVGYTDIFSLNDEMSDEELEELFEQYPEQKNLTPEEEILFNQVEQEFRIELQEELNNLGYEEITEADIPEVDPVQTEFIRVKNYYIEVTK